MKDSILNIKNILRIIISVLIIFSMLKSCARAESVTLDMLPKNSNIDKEQALEEILSHYGYINSINSLSGNMKTNWENYKRNWQNATYSLIYIWYNSNAGGSYANMCNMSYLNNKSDNKTSPNTSIISNTITYSNTRSSQIYKSRINDSMFDFFTSNDIPPKNGSTFYYILVQDNEGDWYEYSNDGFEILQHLIPPFDFQTNYIAQTSGDPTLNLNKFSYKQNSIKLGTLISTDYYAVDYRLKDGNGIVYGSIFTGTNNGEPYNYNDRAIFKENNDIYASTIYLTYQTLYHLEITAWSDSSTSQIYDYYFVFYPPNAIIGGNGVVTSSGSGDFNNQDIAIQNQQNAENSNNLMQDLYNKAFSISGDYIQSKIEELKLNNNFSGDVEIEKAFIGLLSGDTQDFKISWNAVATHFTYGNYGENTSQVIIPSGEVNFSKIERENEEFQEVMNWVRIILGFSFGAMLLRNYWTTLLETLGIGIQPFDSVKEEKAIMTETIIEDARGEKTRQVRVTKGNKTYIKKYKMNNYKQIGGE